MVTTLLCGTVVAVIDCLCFNYIVDNVVSARFLHVLKALVLYLTLFENVSF